MKRRQFSALILLSILTLPCHVSRAADADEVLRKAELSRGAIMGTEQGVQWTVNVDSTENGEAQSAKLSVTAEGGKIFAEILEPLDAQGRKYIVDGDDMWFFRPGLSRPVSVSKRQRLSGDAAIGDVASTNFLDGYDIAGVEHKDHEGVLHNVYTLTAASRSSTYGKIIYWVSSKGGLGSKAEYYAPSGKLLRIATMSYGNQVTLSGESVPFISEMKIEDITGSHRVTTLHFTDVQIGDYPDSLFDPENLKG